MTALEAWLAREHSQFAASHPRPCALCPAPSTTSMGSPRTGCDAGPGASRCTPRVPAGPACGAWTALSTWISVLATPAGCAFMGPRQSRPPLPPSCIAAPLRCCPRRMPTGSVRSSPGAFASPYWGSRPRPPTPTCAAIRIAHGYRPRRGARLQWLLPRLGRGGPRGPCRGQDGHAQWRASQCNRPCPGLARGRVQRSGGT